MRMRDGWVPVVYAAVGLALYAPALSAFFLADDFYFLDIASSAHDVRVIFMPLIGRFVRPLVVLLYYACYQAAGPTPWIFHLAVFAFHVLNASLVFLLGRRLVRDDGGLSAFLAGLLFVVFSSHSEAVAWVAGAADPIVALGLLTGFLCFLRARDPDSSPAWIVLSLSAVAAASFAKESWIVLPGLVLAYAACFPAASTTSRRRTAIFMAASVALVAVYLLGRLLVFGSITGGFTGLGTTIGSARWPREAVKFVFRCVLPAGPWVLRFWPLAMLGVLVTAVAILVRWHRGLARALIFTGAATAIALVPVLPLSISVVNTESERFTYVATAFSSLLIVCAARMMFRGRTSFTLACGVLIIWHAAVLVENTKRVHAAGVMVLNIARSFVDEVREHDAGGRSPIFLLNLPDNLGGTYVFRSGFSTAVRLVVPDAADLLSRTTYVATHGIAKESDRAVVRHESADAFAIEVAPNELIQRQLGDGPRHHVLSVTRTGYRVQFRNPLPTLVLAFSGGRIEYAGNAKPQAEPFGAIDIPSDGVRCQGASVMFAGWALDDEGVDRVRIERSDDSTGVAPRTFGEAGWRPGARPDVAALFPSWPAHDRAGWEFELPCAVVPADGVRVRVTAVDRQGHSFTLGERQVNRDR
jgi:hypothetical protein